MMGFCSVCVFVLFCLFSLISLPSKIKNWHHLISSPSFLWKLYWFLKPQSSGNVPKNPSSHSYTQAHLGEETQKAGSCGGGRPSGPCSRCLYFGAQGPGTGRNFSACSVPPAVPSPPPQASTEEQEQLVPATQEGTPEYPVC